MLTMATTMAMAMTTAVVRLISLITLPLYSQLHRERAIQLVLDELEYFTIVYGVEKLVAVDDDFERRFSDASD